MKKNYLKLINTVLLAALFLVGCQKEFKQPIEESADQLNAARSENQGVCRLTAYEYYDAANDYHQVDSYSYKDGLVDEMITFYGSLFTMEYDNKGKLKISRMYDGETLIYTIHFIYEKNKVVKEIWYDGSTGQVSDEVINTYNQKGEMIRNESINFDYFVEYEYTNRGDVKSWFYYSGGLPIQKAEYTYRDEVRNPLKATPGIEYSFAWANSGFGTGNRWSSSEKITIFNEDGNPFVYYDQDPFLTVWQLGPQNYPLQVDYFDTPNGSPVSNIFEYENCVTGNTNSKAHVTQPSSTISSRKINRTMLLNRHPSKSVKEAALELRGRFRIKA